MWEIGCEVLTQNSGTLGQELPQDQGSENFGPGGHNRQSKACQPWTPSTRVRLWLRV